MEAVTSDRQKTQHEIRLQNLAQRIADLEELLKIEQERRDNLIVEAVDSGLHPKLVARAARRSLQRVNQILGGD